MRILFSILVLNLCLLVNAYSADFSSIVKYAQHVVFPDSFFSDQMSSQEKVNLAEQAFNVTEETAQSKFLYAFFVDSYEAESEDEQEKSNNLKKYEWFSSNLTAIYFANKLEKFLLTEDAKQLNEFTVAAINNFISLLSKSFDDGYLIDSCRAYHPGLAYLAASGDSRFAVINHDLDISIEDMIDRTIQQIRNLSVNEEAIFLSGTILHETRIVVKKISEEKFDYVMHDSAELKYIATKKELQLAEIIDRNLWRQIYEKKLTRNGLLGGFADEVHHEIDISSIKLQKKNTCHFRCLHSVLKNEILSLFADQDQAVYQWQKFKVIFGEWLLSKHKSNDLDLNSLCVKKQNEREFELNLIKKLLSIGQDDYQSLLDSFNRGIRSLSTVKDQDTTYITLQKDMGKIQTVLAMRHVLMQKMEQAKVSGANFEPFFKTTKNINLEEFFDKYQRRTKFQGDLFFKQVMTEIREFFGNNLSFASCKLKFYSLIRGNDKALAEFEEPSTHERTHVNLNLDQLKQAIANLKDNPALLTNLVIKPSLSLVICQGLWSGMIDDVLHIYNNLSNDDKKVMDSLWLNYCLRAFINIDFDTIMKIYSDNSIYPKFIKYRIFVYLSDGEIPYDSILNLSDTIDEMFTKVQHTPYLKYICFNMLRILLNNSDKIDVLVLEKVLKRLDLYASVFEFQFSKNDLSVVEKLKKSDFYLDLNNFIQFYTRKLESKIVAAPN